MNKAVSVPAFSDNRINAEMNKTTFFEKENRRCFLAVFNISISLFKKARPASRLVVSPLLLFFCWSPFSFFAQPLSPPELHEISNENVFEHPPFKSCHASTIVALPGDKQMCAWFAGSGESNPDVAIWSSVRINGEWQKPSEIVNGEQKDGSRYACWNPVLFLSQNNDLFLFYKVGKNPREWWGEVKISNDYGLTWSPARKLPTGFIGPVKNKPIQLANGDLLCPSSTESNIDDRWRVHIERCNSTGLIWSKTNIDCDTFDVIQPSILRYGGDTLQLLCRSRQNVIMQSWSFDNGKSWGKMRATSLPNPNSGSDAVTLATGWQLLVYNPLTAGKDWWDGRSVLKVAMSGDGKEWQDVYTLEQHEKGEYSYPAVIQSPDESIHITYTLDRKNIRHVVLKEK